MSRRVRFASVLLILGALTCGSLGALPLGLRPVPAESTRIGFVTAVVEWIASLFTPDRETGRAPAAAQPKGGTNVDPNGGGS